MTLLDKIRLSRKFGKTTYVISAILTVAMSMLVAFYPMLTPAFICIKLLSIPMIYYLRSIFEGGSAMYFYINLGISKREYWLVPIIVEFAAFVILMVVSNRIGYAIG